MKNKTLQKIAIQAVAVLFVMAGLLIPATIYATQLSPMLNLPATGENPTLIDFLRLPVLKGEHALITRGTKPWLFRLHSYLAFYDDQYWCAWSHGHQVEDLAGQEMRYATSKDGLKWSEAKQITGAPTEGFRYISRGLWVRDGRLIALAGYDEATNTTGGKGYYFGKSLQLFGWEWQPSSHAWKPLGVLFDKAINNFPPAKMSNGEWGMICRGPNYRKDVFMLTGGIASPFAWTKSPIVTEVPANGFRPEEPDWWTLPDGRLLGLFRDNSRSGRFYRAVSADNGHTWSAPEKSNFPDATSKFFCFRTSRGFYVLVSNANPKGRNPLCLSTSDDGATFTRMAQLPVPVAAEGGKFDAAHMSGTVQYPHAMEHDGYLLIVYSRNKTDIEVIKISLDEVERLREGKLAAPLTGKPASDPIPPNAR